MNKEQYNKARQLLTGIAVYTEAVGLADHSHAVGEINPSLLPLEMLERHAAEKRAFLVGKLDELEQEFKKL